MEILSGLKAGDIVVVEGSDRLADGMPVQVATAGEGPDRRRARGSAERGEMTMSDDSGERTIGSRKKTPS